MASFVVLEFISRPDIGDEILVSYNNGVFPVNLSEIARSERIGANTYEVATSDTDDIAGNYAFAFEVDSRNNVGDSDILVTLSGSEVKITLQNESWQFSSVTGDSITKGHVTASINNGSTPEEQDFTYSLDSADCTEADYELDIIGGNLPFTIYGSNADLTTGPISTPSRNPVITLFRGVAKVVRVVDSSGVELGRKSIVPPKQLNAADFTISLSQENGAKATVEPNIVLDSQLLPVTYSLNGVDYSGGGVFTGLTFNFQYTLYIKDAHGCVRTKTFITPQEITGGDTVTTNYERYSEISNAGSGIFSILTSTPTNHYDSLSFEEKVKLPFETTIFQYKDWDFVGQFKSSYNYHKITLVENGSAIYIEPVLQVQNLGLQEKVDCKLFRDNNLGLGIYFRNGSSYVPNTTSVSGTSDYDAVNLPTWARSGTTITIDGIGAVKIKRVTTDPTRGLYLQTNASYSSLTDDDGKVQANYNEQKYNTYEYMFPVSLIDNCARIIIEKGYLIDGVPKIEIVYGSERIQKITDMTGFLDLSWRDPENKAGMVHQTGIVSRMLLPYVKWVGNSESSSELYDTDSESVSLKQEVKDVQLLIAKVIGFKMQQKLQIAAGMEEFMVNGINYKKREMTSTPLKSSNWYRVEATFEFGANQLEINPDEIVLNPPSTPLTNKGPITTVQPSPLTLAGGELLNESGKTILIEE